MTACPPRRPIRRRGVGWRQPTQPVRRGRTREIEEASVLSDREAGPGPTNHPAGRASRRLPAILFAAFAAGTVATRPAPAADPVPYRTTLLPSGDGAVDAALRGSSSLLTLQKTRAVSPFALVGRARSDVDRLRTVLESFGYYAGQVLITVQDRPVADPDLPDVLGALPKNQPANIRIAVTRGPLFHLGRVDIHLPPGETLSAADRAGMELREGQPAVASDVIAAQGRLLVELQNQGHAFATVPAPKAYLRPDARLLDIVFDAKEGPRVDIGAITLQGLKKVHATYVRRELLIHPGQLYQPEKIEAARQDLASTGVFSDVAVNPAPSQEADGRLPLVFTFTEAPRHTVALQAGYSTDLGGSAGVTWTHHNLFGNGEKLELAALVTGL
ncbi:MAG: hypothetical protein INR65_20255, partial [Gluconacetobacter diazotrophicus]|nr:hypothetical protein [Gluconacetobacter diazotrophicus]